MKQKKINKKPTIIRVDPELDKYLESDFAKKKVEEANKIIKKYGLPKDLMK